MLRFTVGPVTSGHSKLLSNSYLLGLACLILLLASFGGCSDEDVEKSDRAGKFLSFFQVMRFPNGPCEGSGAKNGTCYTDAECTERGGTPSGVTCATGFGMCCIFNAECDGVTRENNTYFATPTGTLITTPSECSVKVCSVDTEIVQMRLDFETFVIAGPSTDTAVSTKILNGQVSSMGVDASSIGQCLIDRFSVSNPSGGSLPVICGTLANEHMYVDVANNGCIDLTFQFGTIPMGAPAVNRMWSIKVMQYARTFSNLAPRGCTQFHFGTIMGMVNTFNFASGVHLANQNQNICVRREAGACRVCWIPPMATDFDLSGSAMNPTIKDCCNYGTDGMQGLYDCAAFNDLRTKGNGQKQAFDRICGMGDWAAGLKDANMMPVAKTLCSVSVPFAVRFISDNYEITGEATATDLNAGFRLQYALDCPLTTMPK